MSKRAIVAAFVAGTLFAAPVAMAANVIMGHMSITVDGKRIGNVQDVKYKGATYISTNGVMKAIGSLGTPASLRGNTLTIGNAPYKQNPGAQSNGGGTPVTITDADYSALQGGNSYVGKTVNLVGQVFETPQRQNGHIVAQVDITPDSTGDFVDVVLPSNANVQKDEFVKVTGVVSAQLANLVYPQVNASTITQTTWGDAFYPTTQTLTPNLSSEQNNFTLSITKVEIARGQVRVFLSATNNSGANVSVDDSMQDTLTQGSTQLNQDTMTQTGYPDFAEQIANGTNGTAVLVFDGSVSSGALTLTLPVSSDNYDQNWTNFVFTIPTSN